MLQHDRLEAMLLGDVLVENEVNPELLEGLNIIPVAEVYGSIYTSLNVAGHQQIYNALEDATGTCRNNGWTSLQP